MQITFLIRATQYALDEEEASWLASVTRKRSVDPAGQAWDREARAAFEVAQVITEHVERRHSPEPIDLDRSAALGLLHVFHDGGGDDVQGHVARDDGVAALYLALRRFGRDLVEQRG